MIGAEGIPEESWAYGLWATQEEHREPCFWWYTWPTSPSPFPSLFSSSSVSLTCCYDNKSDEQALLWQGTRCTGRRSPLLSHAWTHSQKLLSTQRCVAIPTDLHVLMCANLLSLSNILKLFVAQSEIVSSVFIYSAYTDLCFSGSRNTQFC